MSMDRRDFLKVAGAQAGVLLTLPQAGAGTEAPAVVERAPEVVVIGAGAFGGWTAFHLRRMGASVMMVDAYGPGNSRATSGDETRGIRSSYGERESWVLWAKEAIKRWQQWDEEWAKPLKRRLFFTTGDIIMRARPDAMITESRATWDKHGFKYELLTPDELRYRFPQIKTDTFGVGLYEPDAGVARARRSCEVLAEAFQKLGGKIAIGLAAPGRREGRRLNEITMTPGDAIRGDVFVFACGPWLPKVLPEVMANKLRIPLGHVFYYATPPGDNRFTWPNCPSWNVPGVTGWPALGNDNRGFRVRTGGRPPQDPDTSVRWVDYRYHEVARNVLDRYFPDLYKQPLLETRSCHYESSATRNFIIDRHPEYDNVWIAGGGNAEAFKMGPVSGEYVAKRVLGKPTDPALDAEFKLTDQDYDQTLGDPMRSRRLGIAEVEELL
ncbi:MAG TPA: FAD-dependent oxidoreductase [Longimicrobiales bacterium]|nr:FAD-dependent oxidoreductase [Longimicrobiales bacterium]